MEEMLDDALQMEDDEELEEEADAEVDKVLYDLTEGKLGQAGTVQEELPVCLIPCLPAAIGSLCPSHYRTRRRTRRRRGLWKSTDNNCMAF